MGLYFKVSEAAMAKDGDGNYLVNGQNVLIPLYINQRTICLSRC